MLLSTHKNSSFLIFLQSNARAVSNFLITLVVIICCVFATLTIFRIIFSFATRQGIKLLGARCELNRKQFGKLIVINDNFFSLLTVPTKSQKTLFHRCAEAEAAPSQPEAEAERCQERAEVGAGDTFSSSDQPHNDNGGRQGRDVRGSNVADPGGGPGGSELAHVEPHRPLLLSSAPSVFPLCFFIIL